MIVFPLHVRQNTKKLNNTHLSKTTSEPRVASGPLLNTDSRLVIRMRSTCKKGILTCGRPLQRRRRELLKASILGFRWQDYVPDVEVLHIAQAVRAKGLIATHQLRWAGHVC